MSDSEHRQVPIQNHLGIMEVPVHYMRGGTSTGVVIADHWVPQDESLRTELLLHLMGAPLSGHQPCVSVDPDPVLDARVRRENDEVTQTHYIDGKHSWAHLQA